MSNLRLCNEAPNDLHFRLHTSKVPGNRVGGDGVTFRISVGNLRDGHGDCGEIHEDARARETDSFEEGEAEKDDGLKGGGDGEGEIWGRGLKGEHGEVCIFASDALAR